MKQRDFKKVLELLSILTMVVNFEFLKAHVHMSVLFLFFFLFFSLSGRVRYKFASFWNRNHALRNLQRAAKNFQAMEEAEKKVCSLYSILLYKTYRVI